MAGSTYSTNLKIELMTTGENSGTWGDITNTNLGTALEQAVVGYGNPDYVSDANLTISITNSNAAQPARALVLNVTSTFGSLTATRELVVPTIQKQYIVQNNTTGGQSITVKTSAGTGITVPNGRKAHLYVDGTNVIQMFDFVDINGGTIDGATVGANSASTGAFTSLTASGATTLNGAVALGDASGDLITFPGTINSSLLFTDNTYDIGASGATRPRNLFLAGAATIGGNLSVGGTLTLTGGVNLNGNVTVGDSAADTLTINSTITSNLIFTDNTYDIGASGATRPRNLFLAGNATVGGAQTLTGALTVDSTTDSSSTTTGSIQTDGGVGIAKALYVGTTANIAGAVTLSGGTANGVLYLNGSKVATSGSALVFDGTNLSVGTTALSGGKFSTLADLTAVNGLVIRDSATTYANNDNYILLQNSAGATAGGLTHPASQSLGIWGFDDIRFVQGSGATEGMRLLPAGLVVGTTSLTAGTKFNVTGNNVTFTPNTAGKDTHTFSTGAADVGTYTIKNDTTVKVSLNAGGTSYFTGGGVAIGATSASGALDVTGRTFMRASGSNSILTFYNQSGGDGTISVTGASNTLNYGFSTFSVSNALYIQNNGFIGINTSSPGQSLDVNGNIRSRDGGITLSTGTTQNGVFSTYNIISGAGTDYTPVLFAETGYGLAFLVNGSVTKTMSLTNAGQLLVGTTTTSGGEIARFQTASGNTSVGIIAATNGGSYLNFGDTSDANVGYIGYDHTNNYMNFRTNGAEAARFTSGGNFYVGATSGLGAATVNGLYVSTGSYVAGGQVTELLGYWMSRANDNNGQGGVGIQYYRVPRGGGVQTGTEIRFYTGFSYTPSTTGHVGTFDQNGNFLVGFSQSLTNTYVGVNHVTGSTNGASFFVSAYNGAQIGDIAQSGTTAVVYNTTSDYRLKNNPQPLTNSGAFIDALQPKTWTWTTDGSKGAGFIAHEFAEVSPSSVTGTKDAVDENGNPKYQGMQASTPEVIANLVAEIQSLRQRLAAANIA